MLSLVYSLLVSTRTPLAHTPTTLLLLVYYRHQHCPRPPRPRSGKRAKEKPNGDVRLPKQFKECEARRLIGAESVFPARVSACKYISFRACATRCTRSAERCLDASSSGRSTRKRRSTRSLPLPPPSSSGVAVPSPPSPGCAALSFASFTENVHVMYS